MRSFLNVVLALVTLSFVFVSCTTGGSQTLREKIRQTSSTTEDLFEAYEELNEELFEVTLDYEKAYKKLIKAKDAQREMNGFISNRQKRIQAIQTPIVKEGEPVAVVDNSQLESHQEKLAEYEEELKEILAEVDKWTTLSKELNEKALTLRPARNAAYDAYIKSRDELNSLKKQLDAETVK